MPLSKHVEEIITREGSAKASIETRRSRLTSSRPLNERAQINEDVKKICRLAVRPPSDEVVNQLHVIHGKMKEPFLNMSDEGITWMLGGSSEMSRGGFHDDPKKA